MATNPYTITGHVVDQSGTGQAVYIEVWDWDVNGPSDDLLIARSVSKPDGSFDIDITADVNQLQKPLVAGDARKRPLDTDPDIYLKIHSITSAGGPDKLLEDRRSRVVKNVKTWPLDLGLITLSSSGISVPPVASTPAAPPPISSVPPPAPSASSASGSGPSGKIRGRIVVESSGKTTGVADADTKSVITLELNGVKVDEQPIDSRGEFDFMGLAAGIYLVRLPRIVTRTGGASPLAIDNPDQSEIEIDLPANDDFDLSDFLYDEQGLSIHGVIFLAENKGDLFDDRPRLTGVRVELVRLNQPTATPAGALMGAAGAGGDPLTLTTTTDLQGEYSFEDIESGNHVLRVDPTLNAADLGLGEGTLGLATELRSFFVRGQSITRNIAYTAIGGFIQGTVFFDKDLNKQRRGGEPVLTNIPVLLVDALGKLAAARELTKPDGSYEFSVPPGTYTLRFRQTLTPDPNRGQYADELALTTEPEQTITVKAAQVARALDTGYRLEPHEIIGQVIYEDGAAFEGLVVRLEQNGTVLRTATTGPDGRFKFENVRGTFKLHFPEDPFASQLISPQVQQIDVNSVANAGIIKYRRPSDDRGPAGLGASGRRQDQLIDVVSDIASYMPTSQEVGGPVGRAPSGSGTTADIQQLVDRELMSVLGGRVKLDSDSKPDAAAFVTSLTRAFQAKDVDGHTSYKHIPRAYAVQTELGGAITGAQASFYRRAKVALDDALPLLDGLQPLDPAADDEETAAVRSIVRTEFIELVNEFGREGGPRVQRVDQIFDMLTLHIEDLEERFELKLNKVVTVEEEQNLTNFEVVRDYIASLRETWRLTRERFNITGTDTKYLGTQLVRLSRALNSVAESVEETYRVMDAVLLGPSERQTVLIDFPRENGEIAPPMLVEELLSWVARFATEEGPALIKEGGRRGVLAIQPVAVRLQRLVDAASRADVKHVAFKRVRVRRALEELASQIDQVARLANQLADAPRATSA